MSKKIDIEELKKENNFKIPAHYFESLEVEIQHKIEKKTQKNFLYRFRYPAIAFSATCLAMCIWILNKNEIAPVNNNSSQSIDYVQYVDEHIDEFDEELVFETYTPVAFERVSESEKINNEKSTAVEEYLLDEGVDEDWIIEEL